MATPFWLKQLRSTRNRRQTAGSRRKTQPRARPHVELLEERMVPSTLVVTNSFDDGSAGSLRSAISQANTDAANGVSDTINFNSSLAGTTIDLTQGELELSGAGTGTITIDGSALSTPITISGAQHSRVFDINAAGAAVQINGLTITDGYASAFDAKTIAQGGDIFNAGTLTLSGDVINGGQAAGAFGITNATGDGLAGGSAQGGGIFNAGTGVLVIDNTAVTGNTASGGEGGFGGSNGGTGGLAQGGGVFSELGAQLTFQNNSTVSGNAAVGGVGGDSTGRGGSANEVDGGGVFNAGTLAINATTFTANEAVAVLGGNGGGQLQGGGGNGWSMGGGICNEGATITLSGCTFSGNSASAPFFSPGALGGGISNIGGTVTANNCTLSDNSATVPNGGGCGGGGIYNDSTLNISGCALSGNSGNFGAAIWNIDGTTSICATALSANSGGPALFNANPFTNSGPGSMTITACTFTGNSGTINNYGTMTVSDCIVSSNSGGISSIGNMTVSDCTISGNSGLGLSNSGTMTVSGCTVSGNGGFNLQGGGIGNAGTMTVSDCTVDGNVTREGGGIFNSGRMAVSDCTVSGNSATTNGTEQDGGGGIFNQDGAITVSSSTISGNFTDGSGGGIFNVGVGTVTISDCTLSGNVAQGGNGGCIVNSQNSPNAVPMTLTDCSLSGNSTSSGNGSGGAIVNAGSLILNSCNLTGNSTRFLGGAICNVFGDFPSTVTVNGCTLAGNSTGSVLDPAGRFLSGGGAVFNDGGNIVTVDGNSAVYGNQAPVGADLENLGVLSISHSAVASVDDQNPGATTINIAATNTATAFTSFVNASGQIVFTVKVLAAQAGAGIPTGTVTLYDGNNNILVAGLQLDASGQYTIADSPTVAELLASATPLHAGYVNDGNSNFSGSTSAPLIQTADALTPGIQTVVDSLAASPATAVALQVTDEASWEAALAAINAVSTGTPLRNGIPVTVVLDVGSGKYSQLTYANNDANVTLILRGSPVASGTIVDPATPALTVTTGKVAVENVTFTESGDAPTILVTGGHLILRNDIVQESTAYNDAAIAVSGGSVDLGTVASPGGNTININGTGQALVSTGLNLVTAVGNTFQANGAAIPSPVAAVAIAASANPSLLNQPITFTATVSATQSGSPAPTGTVTFVDMTTGVTLGNVAVSGGKAQLTTSALPLNAQSIAAIYSGDTNYITSAAALVQIVRYKFSGFLAPLNSTLALALGRTVPIKLQLTDYNGAFLSSLSAVKSLVVTGPSGTTALTGSLRYDPTSNQYVVNWQTKGLSAGTYTVTLVLNDGTAYTKSVQLTKNGNSSGLTTVAAGGTGTAPGGLLGGDIDLYVDNTNGDLTADELARIQDAVTAADAVTAPYGVAVTEVTDPTLADVTLNMDTTSAVGGYADGVLGCTTDAGQITIINGSNFYAGSDATQIGSAQYDFETVVTHELGHALGLGHSTDSTSVMNATLNTGTVNRTLTTADLNVPDSDTTGACGLHAAIVPTPVIVMPPIPTSINYTSRDAFFAHLVGQSSASALMRGGIFNQPTPDAAFVARLENDLANRGLVDSPANIPAIGGTLIFGAASLVSDEDAIFGTMLFSDPLQDGRADDAGPSKPAATQPDGEIDFMPNVGVSWLES
jgi:hypothetical protein